MNEPSIFYSKEGADRCRRAMEKYLSTSEEEYSIMEVQKELNALANDPRDYANFYHNVDGKMVCHEKVHNLFGYYMTRAGRGGDGGVRAGAADPVFLSFLLYRHAPVWRGLDR